MSAQALKTYNLPFSSMISLCIPQATPAMVHHVTAHVVLQSPGVAALKVVVVNSERNFLHIEMPGIVKMVAY